MDVQKMYLLGRLAASFRTSVSIHIRQGGLKRQSYFELHHEIQSISSHIRGEQDVGVGPLGLASLKKAEKFASHFFS